jgi:hypothetical protein
MKGRRGVPAGGTKPGHKSIKIKQFSNLIDGVDATMFY